MKLKYVTLTGADEKTNISELKELSKEFPFVEWAFLLSNDGKSDRPRYPSLGWIAYAISELNLCNVSIHLCGSIVSEYVYGVRNLKDLTWSGRVQLNLPKYINLNSTMFIINLRTLLTINPNIKFILQHNDINSELISNILNRVEFKNRDNLQILRDCSGGHGVREESWEVPQNLPERTFYGFAGGIGPQSVEADLATLAPLVGDKETWIDMESKIRKRWGYTEGSKSIETNILDLDACRTVLKIAQKYT